MYKVNDITFNTFEEVIKYAWNVHFLDCPFSEDEMTEQDKQNACRELEEKIAKHEH